MAAQERVISMRLRLKGEQAVIDSLEDVNETLAKSGGFLKDIDTKSKALENMTRRLKAMAAELESVNRRFAAAQSGTGSGNAGSLEAAQKRLRTEIENTTKSTAQLRKELLGVEQGSKAYNDLVSQIAKAKAGQKLLNDEIRKQQVEFERTKVAAGSYRDLELQLQQLRAQYKLLGEAQRNSATGDALLKQIGTLDTKLKDLDKGIGVYTRNVGNYASAFNGFVGVASKLGAVLGATFGINEFIQANALASDSVADVAKTANISIEAVRKFQEELKGRDTRTSLVNQLGIAEIGGQLGVVEDQLLDFTKATDIVTVALKDEFGGSVQEVTKQVATLRNVIPGLKTEDVGEDILRIGNALNFLSAEGNATSPVIADFVNRLSGVAGPLNISSASIFGLSATLDELGVSAERGSTAAQNALFGIAAAPAKFAQIAGKSVEEFTKIVEDDLVLALGLVSKGAQESTEKNTEFVKLLAELGIEGVREIETFGKLGGAYDLLTKRVEQAGQALQETSSVTQEFEKKNNTFGASIDKLKNSIINLTVNSNFQDFLSAGINAVSGFINVLAGLPKLLSENKTEFVALGAAILVFNQQSILASVAAIRQSAAYLLLTDATKRQAVAQGILNAITKAFPLLAIIAAVYLAVKAYQALTASTDGAARAAERFKDAQKEIAEEVAKEASALKRNIDVLKNASASTRERAEAIRQLKEAYPDYLEGMDLEKLSVDQLTQLQDKLTNSIIRSVAERKKAAAQDAVAAQIIEKQLRISAIRQGGQGEVSIGEQLRLGSGGANIEKNVQSVISGLTKELNELQKEFDETGKKFDEAFGLRKTGTEDVAASGASDLINERKAAAAGEVNLRKLTISQLEAINNDASKMELERRKKLQENIKQLAEQRLKDEKTAADNILKLQNELIDKTFAGRKRLAINETNTALSALVGTPQQIEAQKNLLLEKLQQTLDAIRIERDKAVAAAQADIDKFKLQSEQAAAERGAGSFGNQLEAVRGLGAIDEQKATGLSTINQALLDEQLQAGLLSQEDYKTKSEEIALQLERDILDIRNRQFVAEKELLVNEQNARLEALAAGYQLELQQIADAEAARRAELQGQLDNGVIDQDTFNAARRVSDDTFRQERLDAERNFREEQSGIIQEAATDIINTEVQLAQDSLALQQDTDAQKLESARRTKEQMNALQNAQLDAVGEYVSGVSKLLSQDQENRKKYGGILKALALAEVAINLRRELSAISLAAIQAGAATGPFGFITAGGLYATQSIAAILKAAFNSAAIIAQKFQYGGTIGTDQSIAQQSGGSIPSGSGEIKGRSHKAGGVKAVYNGRLVEFEGGEYHLRNGKETYIINRKSTSKFRQALLRLSDSPTRFSSQRKEMASRINSFQGWGKPLKYAEGGVAPSALDLQPLAAPQVANSTSLILNAASRDEVDAVLELAATAAALAEAANNRIDNIQVINDPLETLDAGSTRAEIRSVRNL